MLDDDVISQELQPGETILWYGQPSIRKNFRISDFILPVMLDLVFVFGVVLVFGNIASFSKPSDVIGGMAMMGFFALFCGYVTIGGLLGKKRYKLRLHYAITDKRILCVKAVGRGGKRSIAAVDLAANTSEAVSIDKRGIGTIVSGNASATQAAAMNCGEDFYSKTQISSAFCGIDDAQAVYQIYKSAQTAARG